MSMIADKTTEGGGRLTVYRASAGSGKTFRLTTEYIKLLLRNPYEFQRTLAVTFTNKATEEMKTRLLSTLYGLGHGLPSAESYRRLLCKETGMTAAAIDAGAAMALEAIMRHYNDFKVETIDSFFQRIVRNLARELGLNAGLTVELNDKDIESKAVDEMVAALDEQSPVLGWIAEFIGDNMAEDKTWNVMGAIKKFGKNLFKEDYAVKREALNAAMSQEDFFNRYRKTILSIKQEAEEGIKKIVSDYLSLAQSHGIDGTELRSYSLYFKKIAEGKRKNKDIITKTLQKALDGETEKDIRSFWATAATLKSNPQLEELIFSVFHPSLIEAERQRIELTEAYNSSRITLEQLSELRLLHKIEEQIRADNNAHHRFLLSETQPLLHAMISGSDAPFIYEKMGTTLDHIMIDEFQDTSRMQWLNFKVLLDECLSRTAGYAGGNLIVGDVKQSIYRWRSSDWRLMSDIAKTMSQATNEEVTLDTNFRSEATIISFNNCFFKEAVAQEISQLDDSEAYEAKAYAKAYEDCVQKIGPQGAEDWRGYVHVAFYEHDEADEKIGEQTYETIKMLLANGVSEKDIVVIGRKHGDLQHIADYCRSRDHSLRLVSDEAFMLETSTAVCMMILAAKVLCDDKNQLALASLASTYQQRILGHTIDFDRDVVWEDLLPETFVAERNRLKSTPIYELMEEIFRIFRLEEIKGEQAYVCHFFDEISNFVEKRSPLLVDLIEFWDDTLHAKNIHTDESGGIRLMTIHKCKGLECDNVIIPYCNWKLELESTLWCNANQMPYNELPVIPIKFGSKLKESVYKNDYQREHLMNIVDNMNLLYVAFTRAKKNLYVFAERGKTGYRAKTLETTLLRLAENTPKEWENIPCIVDYAEEGEDSSKQKLLSKFILGNFTLKQKTQKEKHDNIFLVEPEDMEAKVSSAPSRAIFRQSGQSDDFMLSTEKESGHDTTWIGIVLHDVLSKIKTTDDVNSVLADLEMSGKLYGEGIDRNALVELIKSRITNEKVKSWFDGSWAIFNECNILYATTSQITAKYKRPDRVMTKGNKAIVVDFKFASKSEEHAHKQQVAFYMTLLKEMGYKDVEGYLWYVYRNEIVEI